MSLTSVILAAGRGTRLQGVYNMPKPLLPLGNAPALLHTLNTCQKISDQQIIVLKHQAELFEPYIPHEVISVLQGDKDGTGAALSDALQYPHIQGDHILVLNADDSAFLQQETLEHLFDIHIQNTSLLTLLTVQKENPTGLGRIVRNDARNIIQIVEEKDANELQKKITEVATGVYIFDTNWVKKSIQTLTPSEVTGEYYITQIIEKALMSNIIPATLILQNDEQVRGFNTPEEYEQRRKEWDAMQCNAMQCNNCLLNISIPPHL